MNGLRRKGSAKMTRRTSPLGSKSVLLLLQILSLAAAGKNLFATEKNQNRRITRGSELKKTIPDGMNHRELPEGSPKHNKQKNVSFKDKRSSGPGALTDDKQNSAWFGVDKIDKQIEKPPPQENVSAEFHSGRDDIDPGVVSSGSLSSVTSTLDLAELPQPSLPPSIKTMQPDSNPNETKVIAEERLRPIKFDITADTLVPIINTSELEPLFRGFIEDILDMNSNDNWYPLHSKSVSNMTIEMFSSNEYPTHTNNDEELSSPVKKMAFQLVVNGLVSVHVAEQKAGAISLSKRTTEGKEKKEGVNNETVSETETESPFHDSFDHSMLLYLTFWGTKSLREALQKFDLKNPIITAVTVGKKKVISFGIDKDDNYLYNGHHESVKPKHLLAQTTNGNVSGGPKSSAPVGLKCGLLTTVMVSFGILFSIERLLF